MACYPWSWLSQLQQPTLEAFRFMYDARISVEGRDNLSNWIKSQIINTHAYTNDQQTSNELHPDKFLSQLLNKLQRMAEHYSNDISHELNNSIHNLVELFSNNPLQLYQQLVQCIEGQCIAYPYKCIYLTDRNVVEVFKELQRLETLVQKNEIGSGNMKQEYEYLTHELYELKDMETQLDMILNEEIRIQRTLEFALRQEILNDNLRMHWTKRSVLVDDFRHTILMTGLLQDKVLNKYLMQWKINQRLTSNVAATYNECNLDTIQVWCEGLIEIIKSIMVQLKQAIDTQMEGCINLREAPDLMTAMKDVNSLYTTLIFNSFIVEKQPPQIMKTNSRFAVTVRLLLGKTLNMEYYPVTVTVSVISESQAKKIHCTKKATVCSAGKIVNNIGRLEYNENTRQLSARFLEVCLSKIQRMGKRSSKCVMDEKFALLFRLTLNVEHSDVVLPVWAISCPVVVIVHASQSQRGWANILWDNAFAKIDRTPFDVPEEVYWSWLCDVLSSYFSDTSGRPLTPDQLYYLSEKALGHNQPLPIPNDLTIMLSQFCKENLPGCNFTFSEWFYMVTKLKREHLLNLWSNGRIIGFLEKKQAEKYLSGSQPGTFLLRFSDTVLGGITIAFVHESNEGQHKILHIQPFTAKDLSSRSLDDRILDLEELSYLYPDIPKHTAFERYKMIRKRAQDTHYVTTELRDKLIISSDHANQSSSNQSSNNPSSNNPSSNNPSSNNPSSNNQSSYNQMSAVSVQAPTFCPYVDEFSLFEIETIGLFSQDI